MNTTNITTEVTNQWNQFTTKNYDESFSFQSILTDFEVEYTKWQLALTILKNRLALSLEITKPIIPEDLIIEPVDYDYFIEFCRILDIDCKGVIIRNMPLNYDLKGFPYDLSHFTKAEIQQLIERQTYPIGFYSLDKIQNIITREVIVKNAYWRNIIVSDNKLHMAIVSMEKVEIFDAFGTLQNTIELKFFSFFAIEPLSAKFTSDSKFFTVVYEKQYFLTYIWLILEYYSK